MRPIKITGNIFVANLPPGFTDARLAEMFDGFGLVLSAYLARDPDTGSTRNHGLVDLAPASALALAIEELNGTDVEGQRISVRTADPDLALRPPRSQSHDRRDHGHGQPQSEPRAQRAYMNLPAPPPRPPVIVERRPLTRRVVRPVE